MATSTATPTGSFQVKWTGWLIALLLVLCLQTGAGAASFSAKHYVQPAAEDGSTLRVYLFEKEDTFYLLLPSGWNSSALRFTFPQAQLYVDGTVIASGSTVDLFTPGSTVIFQNEKAQKVFKVTVMQGEGIPSLFIDTESGHMRSLDRSKANIETGLFTLSGVQGDIGDVVAIEEIRGRGNSTFNTDFPKRAYQVRLESKTDLLGMGEAKVYNLMADYLDISLLRNRISMDLAKEAGVSGALDCQSVNVYFNGCYNGVYLLTEKVGVNKSRIDIEDLEKATEKVNDNPLDEYKPVEEIGERYVQYYGFDIPNDPADITGGYILELQGSSRFQREDGGFVTSHDMCVSICEPTHTTMAQTRYIADIFDAFHRAILAKDGVDSKTGKRYDALFDAPSLAKVLVLEEICKNFDHEKNSMYFYKDSDTVDPMVYAGPVWDFDRSYGNVNAAYRFNSPTLPLYAENDKSWYFYGNLFNLQSDFQALAKQTYQDCYAPALEVLLGKREPQAGCAVRTLQAYREEIAASAAMNYIRWNSFAVTQIFRHSGQTFDASVEGLERFLTQRYDALAVSMAVPAE